MGTRPGGLVGPVVARRRRHRRLHARRPCPAPSPATTTRPAGPPGRTAKVTAILHEGGPVRFWDHDLGPARPRLLAGAPPDTDEAVTWTDLTPIRAGRSTRRRTTSPRTGRRSSPRGGSTNRSARPAASSWRWAVGSRRRGNPSCAPRRPRPHRRRTGRRLPGRPVGRLPAHPSHLGHRAPGHALPRRPRRGGGDARDVAPGWDRWVTAVAWTPDSAALVVTADDDGARTAVPGRPRRRHRHPADRRRRRLLRPGRRPGRHGLRAAGRGRRSARPGPARSRRIRCRCPAPALRPRCRAPHRGHGHRRRTARRCAPGWCFPTVRRRRRPAPLLLWIHGGPLNSWNGWHWRWNPWIMAAHGYAVLLPDPALSTGYGRAFVAPRLGSLGRGAVHRRPRPHRRRGTPCPRSTPRAPRPWAARSAATWPTGWPGTPTASPRSSRTRACGRSTSSSPPPTRRTTGAVS